MKIKIKIASLMVILPIFANNIFADEVYIKKITQFGDPSTLPQSKTSCVKKISTKVPYCKAKGFSITCGTDIATTCSGWKTETKTLQKEIFFVVNGPKPINETIKKSIESCTDKSTQLAVATAIAVISKTGSTEGSTAAALSVALPFWKVCMAAEITNKSTYDLATRSSSHWTDWR